MARNRTERGLTLLEITGAVLVVTIFIAGVMTFYGTTSLKDKSVRAYSAVTDLSQTVFSTYGAVGNYSSVDESDLVSAGLINDSYLSGSDIAHPFGGEVLIRNAQTYCGTCSTLFPTDKFHIVLTEIPENACKTLLSNWGGNGNVTAISLVNSSGSFYSIHTSKPSPSTINTQCGQSSLSDVVYTFD